MKHRCCSPQQYSTPEPDVFWSFVRGARTQNFGVNVRPNNQAHGANMGPTWVLSAPRWAPCWPHEPCYQGWYVTSVTPSVHESKCNSHAWSLSGLFIFVTNLPVPICTYNYMWTHSLLLKKTNEGERNSRYLVWKTCLQCEQYERIPELLCLIFQKL